MRITRKAKAIILSILLAILILLFLPILFNPSILSHPKKYTERNEAVYYGDKEVKGIDINSWKMAGVDIAKDSFNVFYQGKMVEGIDAATFHEIEKPIYADSQQLYFVNSNVLYGKHKLQPLKGDYDLASFEALGYYSAAYRDKKGIYIQRNRLQIFPTSNPLKQINNTEIDIKSFRSLEVPYWHVDTNRVYFVSYGTIIPCYEIDRASFEIVSSVVAKDKNHVYYFAHYAQTKEKKITSKERYAILAGADAPTFEKCNNSSLIDKGRTIYKDKHGSWVYELRSVRKRRNVRITINFFVRSNIECE